MKTYQSTGYFQQTLVILLICLVSSFVFAGSAFALTGNVIDRCSDCHGTRAVPGPEDYRPNDLTYRNITTGAFVGSHRTHMTSVTTSSNICTPCHGVAPTAMDHRDGKIYMRQNINSTATLRGTYSKGVFFNQTSMPNLGFCSNVNCHFQKASTPVWGSSPYTYSNSTTNDCDQCHGNGTLPAPQDGSHPDTTNKHGLYYGSDALSCARCHADHTQEANKFSHASSAGNRSLILNGTDFTSSSYSKAATNLAYPAFLTTTPANRNGTCTTFYCHSPGTGGTKQADGRAVATVVTAPTWGGTVDCTSCHTGGTTTGPTYANNAPKANVHGSHTKAGVAYTCDVCHFSVTADGTTIVNYSKHDNGFYNVSANTAKTKAFKYAFASTGGTCSSTSCHGQSTPAWGSPFAPVGGLQCQKCHGSQTVAYTNISSSLIAPGTGNYDTSRTAGITARGGMHQEHLNPSSVTTHKVSCNECHIVPAAVNAAPHLQYTTAKLNFTGPAVAYSASPVTTRTAGVISCSNTHCHTGKENSGTNMVPTWNNAGYIAATPTATDCNKCHGLPPRHLYGHVSTARITAITGTNAFAPCVGCHTNLQLSPLTATPAGIFVNPDIHINGVVDGGGHSFPFSGSLHLSAAGTTPWTSCVTSGCHTNGTNTTYPVAVNTPPDCKGCHIGGLKAPSGTSSCWDCHGAGATATLAWPNSTAFPNNDRSHTIHSTKVTGITCAYCHTGAGTGTATHGSGNRTAKTQADVVVALGTQAGTSATWTLGSETCSSSVCHGQKSPAWGITASTNECTKCHGNAAGSYTNFSSSQIAPGGAGRDTGGNTAATAPRVGTHQQHLLAQSNMSQPIHCGQCHTVHTTVQDATHLNYTTSTLTFGSLARSAGHTSSVSRVSGAITCSTVYCHEGNRPAGTGAGQRGSITTIWSFNGVSILDNATIAGTCTNKCHGMPPGGSVAGDGHYGITAPTTVAGLSVCSSQAGGTGCHPTLKVRPGVINFSNGTSVFMNKGAQHIDGIVQGGTCTGCHKDSLGYRRSITGQFTSSKNSHHYQGAATIDGTICYECHWEANVDGTPNSTYHKNSTSGSPVALVVWNTASRPTTPSSATLQYYSSGGNVASSRGAIAKINNHCLGCHNDTNKTTASFSGDSGTPSMYSWEAKSTTAGGFGLAQSIGAKYLSTTTTLWGKYAGNYTNAKSTQTKAFSAHGNASVNQRGWSTLAENSQGAAVANFPNTGATSNVLCFDCHNSHGSAAGAAAANAVTSSYSSVTGRGKGAILKNTVANLGGYTVSYRPYSGGNAAQKNVYRTGAGLCFDCHNNAAAGAVTSPGYKTPWGYGMTTAGGTFGASQAIFGYNDEAYFGKTGSTFAKAQTFPYMASLSVNKGGHLGASSPLTTAGAASHQIGGLCTPCHDPHGVSPGILAANQQYAVPMLKGTFVTSPYKQDATPANTNENRGGGRIVTVKAIGSTPGYHIDQNTMQSAKSGKPATALSWTFATTGTTLQTLTDTQFAGLCMNCHSKATLNNTVAATSASGTAGSWKSVTRIHNAVSGWALTTGTGGNVGNKVHAYTCSKCHSTHNSMLPRLLVTNCLDVKHRGRVASTGVGQVALTQVGSKDTGTARFPGGGSSNAQYSTNPGPWWFAASGLTRGTIDYPLCHDGATAGGAFSQTNQQWNTKSPW